MTLRLKSLLQTAVKLNASDLYLHQHQSPLVRVAGNLIALDHPALTTEQTQELCQDFLTQEQVMRLDADRAISISFTIADLARIRANISWALESLQGHFRILPLSPPTLADLKLPTVIRNWTKLENGLILVAGPAESGKTSTIAALINDISQQRSITITTVEDPVEYLYPQRKGIIAQREVGSDALNMSTALRQVLRDGSRVVATSELRDSESMHAALQLAESGKLVLTSICAVHAPSALMRFSDAAGAGESGRRRLAAVLSGIAIQKLVPDGEKLQLQVHYADGGKTLCAPIASGLWDQIMLQLA